MPCVALLSARHHAADLQRHLRDAHVETVLRQRTCARCSSEAHNHTGRQISHAFEVCECRGSVCLCCVIPVVQSCFWNHIPRNAVGGGFCLSVLFNPAGSMSLQPAMSAPEESFICNTPVSRPSPGGATHQTPFTSTAPLRTGQPAGGIDDRKLVPDVSTRDCWCLHLGGGLSFW